MAKRASSGLSGVSAAQLMKELERRRGRAADVRRERDRLMARVEKLNAQLRELGESTGSGRGRGSQGATRRDNSGTLASALAAVLKGKQMGVTEVADAVVKAGYKTNAENFRTIVNACLLKHKDLFKKVSRGQYTAA
ncbi:MAG: hypothetical protein SFY69_09030 [Planctomycetota bacterium]|nr:hypothetical protein [Planctomycetota bacterium]